MKILFFQRFVDAVSVPYRVHHSRLSYRNIAKQVFLCSANYFCYSCCLIKVALPGNIISIRHDIAHHHELPSLNDLLTAVDFSKQWLRVSEYCGFNR